MSAGSAVISRKPSLTGRPWGRLLASWLLCGLLLFSSGCQANSNPAGKANAAGDTETAAANPLNKLKPLLKPSAPAGQLQEVAAPLAVQQIQAALADRQPRVSIKAPKDGAELASGNWKLDLQVSDWPLSDWPLGDWLPSDGGSVGPGPHVVVQIDDQAPLRLTSTKQISQISLPPLTPGSHRVTAYAAMPWGEAVRSPGAASQIRVQRVAANPLTLPKKGSPQLLLVSPPLEIGAEPVLLDWLLLDAPLQRLRDNDGSWRLRVNLNGDNFIIDQDLPLWLKGLKNGSNSLQLDLLDGRGNPLNGPFNSLVSEIILKSSTAKPRWQQGRLSAGELAELLGQIPNAKQEIVNPELEPVKAAPIEPEVQNINLENIELEQTRDAYPETGHKQEVENNQGQPLQETAQKDEIDSAEVPAIETQTEVENLATEESAAEKPINEQLEQEPGPGADLAEQLDS